MMRTLELLSPAKNCEFGKAAIDHGADAVYIGAPAFGARVAAGNSLQEIEQLAKYAHLYHSKVFATVNTLLFDNEIEDAVKMIWGLYEAGIDALIIQDLGLFECNLPPIALHASTQTHNATKERVKFLEQAGFDRVILARETSLEEMKQIREATTVELEAFVHGALCVSYSGQCYMSQYLNSRSGNRGCCGQPCRSTYDLYNGDGQLLKKEEHLLSLKDFNASQMLESMIDAGICSFKIEGRLKDLSYVKNITAYYRTLLDHYLEGKTDFRVASSGKTSFFFTPDPERTFNRGYTTYFLKGRQPMASHETQKSIGKMVGTVVTTDRNSLTVKSNETFVPGDGCCYFGKGGLLEGFQINHVEGNRLYPNRMPEIAVGTELWRNNDFAFEKKLQGKSAERKIGVSLTLGEYIGGLTLILRDEDGYTAQAEIPCEKNVALQKERAEELIVKQLGKLGDSPFRAQKIENTCQSTYFIATSMLNDLRRRAVEQLEIVRIAAARIPHQRKADTGVPYYEQQLDYRANVLNHLSEQFYQKHHAAIGEHGLEESLDYEGKALMTTRYCLRYELGQCLKLKNNKQVAKEYQGNLYLRNNKNWFLLKFDCGKCQMQIVADNSPNLTH